MLRNFSGSVATYGVDDENWPETDETISTTHPVSFVLDELDPNWTPLGIPAVRWGGECRVEFGLSATAFEDDHRVEVKGWIALFEGDSEFTGDLDAERNGIVIGVPKGGRQVTEKIRLDNTGLGGGDSAEITLSFTNAVLEV
jgi:hypothetical protein